MRDADPGIAVVSIAAAPTSLPPAAPPIAELAVAADVAPPEVTGDGGGGDCALGAAIGQALAADAAALGALAAIPATERSVANTTMVWDGSWQSGSEGPMRSVVEAAIRAAPPECRTAPVTGPRLIFVGGIALAFGSGNWSWHDLLK